MGFPDSCDRGADSFGEVLGRTGRNRTFDGIYAPVQKDAPLHIVSLHYDAFGVQFVLSNISEKSVVNAKIVAVFVVPDGCRADPNRLLVVGIGADNVHELLISPHESAVTFPRDHGVISPILPPSILVRNAQNLAAAYLHVQVGVVEVNFADGTEWRLQEGLPKTDENSAE